MPVTITALYAAILALLMTALAINVTRTRNRLKISVGDGGDQEMLRMMRLHGSAAEYIPIGVLLMGLYELNHGLPAALHAAGIALLVGRLSFVAALWTSARPGAARGIAALLTWLSIVALAALNLWQIHQ
jgi:uncharacterized protein